MIYLQLILLTSNVEVGVSGERKLIRVLCNVLKWPYFMPVTPRLVLLGFTFCQPLLMNRFLDYLQEPASSKDKSIGYGILGAYGVVYLGIAVSSTKLPILQPYSFLDLKWHLLLSQLSSPHDDPWDSRCSDL
jgi:hypothetical protein